MAACASWSSSDERSEVYGTPPHKTTFRNFPLMGRLQCLSQKVAVSTALPSLSPLFPGRMLMKMWFTTLCDAILRKPRGVRFLFSHRMSRCGNNWETSVLQILNFVLSPLGSYTHSPKLGTPSDDPVSTTQRRPHCSHCVLVSVLDPSHFLPLCRSGLSLE